MNPPPFIQLFAFHVAAALLLFIIVNMLGRHSPMFGYESIALFSESDETASFNMMFRIVTPIVLLILIAASCYYVGADRFTNNLFLVIPYYLAFRIAFNVLRARTLLLPWGTLAFQWLVTLFLGWLVYTSIIVKREYLMPDLNTIGNEIWLAIAGYLYILSSRIFSGRGGADKRSENYIKARYKYLQNRYGRIVEEMTTQKAWEPIIYSIMIVEDFNRPAIYRLIERAAFRVHKAKTLGIMQVKTTNSISDEDSIRLGAVQLREIYGELISTDSWRVSGEHRKNLDSESVLQWEEEKILFQTLMKYNSSIRYAKDVKQAYEYLLKHYYLEWNETLHPDRMAG